MEQQNGSKPKLTAIGGGKHDVRYTEETTKQDIEYFNRQFREISELEQDPFWLGFVVSDEKPDLKRIK